MLDGILSQNCRNILPLHTVDQIVSCAKNKRLLRLAGMKCVKIRTYYKAQHLIAQCGKTRISMLEAGLKMDASQAVNK